MNIGCASRGPTIHVVCGDLFLSWLLCLCVAVGAAPILVCVCVPSVRGADTTDRSRRMCMRCSLVCRSCLLLPPTSVCWCCGTAVCVVRGVCYCSVSLLLLPLCVDGLLVCAGGYTQVTGVMAMMMTGRVLLVCALCVLWCGAGGGDALDFGEKKALGDCMALGVLRTSYSNMASGCDKTEPKLPLRLALPITALQAEDTEGGNVSLPGGTLSSGGSSGSGGNSGGGGSSGGGGQALSSHQSGSSLPGGATGTPGLKPADEGEAVTEATMLLQQPPAPPLPSTSSLKEKPEVSNESLKPTAVADSANLGTTKAPQSTEHSPPQPRLPADESPTTAKPSDGGLPEGPAESPEENDLGQSVGTAGQQELNQTDGNETAPPTTAAVTAAQTNATLPDNITEENDSDRLEG
ncbi:mucin-associated surface protein (MASP), putative, partial [Trypanosoma cruzi marinkellei]